MDFYDQLSEKQRTKFDNEKESFAIDFSEIESIYNHLNDRQKRTLLLAVGMFAAAGRTKGIDGFAKMNQRAIHFCFIV